MKKIERIIEDINEGNCSRMDAIYATKGFAFFPMIFNEDYNERQDWSVSFCHNMWGWPTYEIDVHNWDGRYKLKLSRAEKKLLDAAYSDWYEREIARHRANAKEAAL